METNWKPKTIVMATDFSRASQRATAIARRLALHFDVTLKILHVFSTLGKHLYTVPIGFMIKNLRKRTRCQIQQLVRRLDRAGCSVEAQIIETTSPPADEILRAVPICDNPLIVLGTHSRERVERFLIGSTAEDVVRNTEWPVITVGPGVESTSGLGPFRHFMIATDLSERSFAAVPLLSGLLVNDAKISVVHISSPDDAILGAGWMESIRTRLVVQLGGAAGTTQIRCENYVARNCALKISEVAREEDIDLLLIGLHPGKQLSTHLSPKTGFQIITSAPCPVLSVRS